MITDQVGESFWRTVVRKTSDGILARRWNGCSAGGSESNEPKRFVFVFLQRWPVSQWRMYFETSGRILGQ